MLEKCWGTQEKKKNPPSKDRHLSDLFYISGAARLPSSLQNSRLLSAVSCTSGYIASIYLPFFFPSGCHNDLLLQNCTLYDEEFTLFTLHWDSLHQLCTVTISPGVAPLDHARLADHGTLQLSV